MMSATRAWVTDMAKDSELVRIYVVNGHRTSAGCGPGVMQLPADEAASIVARRYGRILSEDEQPGDLGRTRRYVEGVSN
jgi:hypothetical protein